MTEHQIDSEVELRALVGELEDEHVLAKSSKTITAAMRKYIEQSPFVCLATRDNDGACDVSPRGDAPGFVQILDDTTLVLPDRPGNKRLDSIVNIIEQSSLALLFMIPGVLDTVRVNGKGRISTDPALLGRFEVNGKRPALVIVVSVEEALGHCSKAFRRSRLWQQDYLPKKPVPRLVELMSGHLQLKPEIADSLDAAIDDDAHNNMY